MYKCNNDKQIAVYGEDKSKQIGMFTAKFKPYKKVDSGDVEIEVYLMLYCNKTLDKLIEKDKPLTQFKVENYDKNVSETYDIIGVDNYLQTIPSSAHIRLIVKKNKEEKIYG